MISLSFIEFITDSVYILIPFLYIVGAILKKTPKVKDWVIPWILLTLGMVCGFILTKTFEGSIQGALAAGICVMGNQIYKQTAIKRISDKSK